MVDTTKPAEAKKPEPEHKAEHKPAAAKNLSPAGESGDPVVHKLLAERQAHMSNAEPDPDREAVRKSSLDAVEAIDKQLAELGFTAK